MAAADTPAARRPSGPRLVTDTRVIARRNLRRMARTPRLLIFTCIQPVVFVVLFRYVFGGAIHTPGMKYINYLMPGIFAEAILFGATTAVAISTDLAGGMVDRFRSLPVSRPAFLAGRSIADLARSILVILIVLMVGTFLGFRFHNRFLPSLAGILLMIVFGYSFSWLLAFLGLIVKDPETAQIASLLPLFPFIFASTGFVPIQTMPGWLQAFARNQPVSLTINSVRALTQGGPVAYSLWRAAAWLVGLVVVFLPLAVIRYRKV